MKKAKKAYFWLNFIGIIGMINHHDVVPLWWNLLFIILAHLFCRGISLTILLQFWLAAGLTFLLAWLTNFSWGLAYNIIIAILISYLMMKAEKE